MRGFLAIVIVLSFLPFIYSELGIQNKIRFDIENLKNDIVLHQRINEETYAFEENFTKTVRYINYLTVELDTVKRSAAICAALTIPIYYDAGIFDKSSLSQTNTTYCEDLIKPRGTKVEISGTLPLFNNRGYAFYKKFTIADINFTAFIPEGTVIK